MAVINSKWDKKYSTAEEPGSACRVLNENRHLLPASGRSIDIACGLGANALFLAQCGLDSHACDSSATALTKLELFAAQQKLKLSCQLQDFESGNKADLALADNYDVIVVSHYLYRPLLPVLLQSLRPGGLLFYQTFSQNKLSNTGPSNPDFLLKPQELLTVFKDLALRYYKEDDRAGSDAADNERADRDRVFYIGQKI